jgi:anthranilate synthase
MADTDPDLVEPFLGAPYDRSDSGQFTSLGGIEVSYQVESVNDPQRELSRLVSALDDCQGVLLSSSHEDHGRDARWTVGFIAPPLQIEGAGLQFTISALNKRGKRILPAIKEYLSQSTAFVRIVDMAEASLSIQGSVVPSQAASLSEEERSEQPSLLSLVQMLRDLFGSPEAGQSGLYGALGYDLTFQFEPIKYAKERDADQRDLVMYLPDEIFIIDNRKKDTWKIKYDFTGRLQEGKAFTTMKVPRTPAISEYEPAAADAVFVECDAAPAEHANEVGLAKEEFRVGNLSEVALSQIFRSRMVDKPSNVFRRLFERNPSPYGYFINLGRNEYLVGANQEMPARIEATKMGMKSSPSGIRHWYDGAVGMIGFDGSLNTGLMLCLTWIKDGIAEVRGCATSLHDSDTMAEKKKTELYVSALVDAITRIGDST